jgi:hypothetical protein
MGKTGRKKRVRNQGYFYRNARGWYANDGNSVQICRDHYLKWTESMNEALWAMT